MQAPPQFYGYPPAMPYYGYPAAAAAPTGEAARAAPQLPQMIMPMGAPMGIPTYQAPFTPGAHLSPQECMIYGVPMGSTWSQGAATTGDAAEDDAAGTQV